MKRLGYLSFNSNERTGHQARELKSVRVNSDAYLLRLVVQRCHTNKLNIYNQVGNIRYLTACSSACGALVLILDILQACRNVKPAPHRCCVN